MSIYIEKIEQIALSNKYTKWYINICKNANKRCSNRKDAKELLGYVEAHHILPKCFSLGGETDKENLVYLSGREHFIIHWLATKMFKGNIKYKLSFAFKMFINEKRFTNKKITSIQYNALKNVKVDRPPHSKETKDKISKSRLEKNISPSDETREKQRISMLGKESKRKGKIFGKQKNPGIISEEDKERRRDFLNSIREECSQKRKGCVPHNKGVPHSEEVKQKMRNPRSEEGLKNIREGIKRRDAKKLQSKGQ